MHIWKKLVKTEDLIYKNNKVPYFYTDLFMKYNISEIFKYPYKSKCAKTKSFHFQKI